MANSLAFMTPHFFSNIYLAKWGKHPILRNRWHDKSRAVENFLKKPDPESTKPPSQSVKDVACQEPKPLQAQSSLKDAGEKMRSLDTNRLPVASGDQLVGAVEGKYPERKAAGFGHDPETSLPENEVPRAERTSARPNATRCL